MENMGKIWQALGLTAAFTIVSVTVVGFIMYGLYRYFNRHLPRTGESQDE